MTYQPNANLARITKAALLRILLHTPRSNLRILQDDSDAADQFLADYCRACMGADLTAITEAGETWMTQNKYAPSPAEFGQFARELTRQTRPYVVAPAESQPFPRPAHADAVEARSREAYAVLRGWALVSEAWAVAWEMATDDAMRDDVRLGRLPADVWEDCIGAVLNGRVARGRGPLSDVVRGAA